MTQWAAWLSFDEQKLGSREAGKLADIVILDRDLMTCPEDAIAQTRVHRTIVGGKAVFATEATKVRQQRQTLRPRQLDKGNQPFVCLLDEFLQLSTRRVES